VSLSQWPTRWAVRVMVARAVLVDRLRDERGDLSAYLAQGVLALAAVSLTGAVLYAFTTVGQHLSAIVSAWVGVPISTGSGTSGTSGG
jgi:hypothetical protein